MWNLLWLRIDFGDLVVFKIKVENLPKVSQLDDVFEDWDLSDQRAVWPFLHQFATIDVTPRHRKRNLHVVVSRHADESPNGKLFNNDRTYQSKLKHKPSRDVIPEHRDCRNPRLLFLFLELFLVGCNHQSC